METHNFETFGSFLRIKRAGVQQDSRNRFPRFVLKLLMSCALLNVSQVNAGEVYEEYHKLVGKSQNIAAFGDNLFGEQVDLYSGRTSFSQTDISLPGNSSLPVALIRKVDVDVFDDFNDIPGMTFGEFDVPKLSGIFSQVDGWTVDTSTPHNRCSIPIGSFTQGRPRQVSVGSVPFAAEEFWGGNSMHIPGEGSQQMLVAMSESKVPTSGGPYPWVTKNGWVFGCIPLVSGGTGQGFVGVSPSGVKYTFDKMVTFSGRSLAAQLIKNREINTGFYVKHRLNRVRVVILATKVEDRFGNWVNYEYDTHNRLKRIASNDGREIVLNYSGFPATSMTATAAGRTWTYAGNSIQLPDGSQWTFSGTATGFIEYYESENAIPNTCGGFPLSTMITGNTPPSLVMTHPSGAVGTFGFGLRLMGRSYVQWDCPTVPGDPMSLGTLWQPKEYPVFALTTKTLSGVGIASPTWTYEYSAGNASFLGLDTSGCGSSCPSTVWTEVTRPDGAKVISTFGNKYNDNEGQLLREETSMGGTVLKLVDNTYLSLSQISSYGFLDRIGISPQSRGAMLMSDAQRPLKSSVTTQQGVAFSYVVDDFDDDEFARQSRVTRSSTVAGAPSRTEDTRYHDNTALWVISQADKTTCALSVPADSACDGGTDSVMSETTHDPTWAVPTVSKQFGKTMQTLTYDTTSSVSSGQRGTVRTVADGNNNVTTVTSWKRGIPQAISYADGNTQSAVVNDHGWITSVDDELNSRTCYTYDTMGRITGITYTSESAAETCNTTTWAQTTASFTKSATAKYGLPAGHWQQAVSTGNGRKIVYFDAMWRPVLEEAFDNTNATTANATRSITVKRYDATGRLAFQSYPMASLVNYADTALKGTFTTYDALNRPLLVKQDWEGAGQLTTTTEYLTGFKTRVTNPRAFQTTTEYMAYDQPTTDWPIKITHPASAFTHIWRDPHGKVTKLRRSNNGSPSGGTVAIDRIYVYDEHRQLCKSIEPETSATVVDYDGAGNVAWSASGLPYFNTAMCNRDSVSATVKAARAYDARNRLTNLTFADGRGNQSWTYTPDGLPASIQTANDHAADIVTNTYTYNRRRLPTSETLAPPGWSATTAYAYNTNGHLSLLTYPNTLSVGFAPNAFGQPTQVGTYATGVSYFPNGGVKQFTYGNGIVHALTQNLRGLPDTSCDYYGTCNASATLNDGYDYDQNGNVAAISDGRTGNRGNRTMTYDGLDRLNGTVSPMFGTAAYTYDVLDNLTRVQVGATPQYAARDHYYCYDAQWRLTNVKTASCSGSTVMGLGYDLQGNLQNRNGQAYSFDLGNRLRAATGVETYKYDGHGRRAWANRPGSGTILSMYGSVGAGHGQSGQLLYQRNDRTGQIATNYLYLGSSLVAIREQLPAGAGGGVTVKYQHTDALGTPVSVTDASRNVIERTENEPYGRVGNRPLRDGAGYTGHVEDAATGLNYMQQRYYDPVIGRFLSVDPVTALSNPVGMFNRYKYAANNPYSFVDPDGRQEEPSKKDWSSMSSRSRSSATRMETTARPGSTAANPIYPLANANQRREAAISEVNGQKGKMEATPHKTAEAAAVTFRDTMQPISMKYGVEIESLLDLDQLPPYRLMNTIVANGLDEKTGIWAQISYPTDGLTTIHSHPIVGAMWRNWPFSPEDIRSYGPSPRRAHYLTNPAGIYRYDGQITEVLP